VAPAGAQARPWKPRAQTLGRAVKAVGEAPFDPIRRLLVDSCTLQHPIGLGKGRRTGLRYSREATSPGHRQSWADTPGRSGSDWASRRRGKRRAVVSHTGSARLPSSADPARTPDDRGPSGRYGRGPRRAPSSGRHAWPSAHHGRPQGASSDNARRSGARRCTPHDTSCTGSASW
jgi:hypothetical protein